MIFTSLTTETNIVRKKIGLNTSVSDRILLAPFLSPFINYFLFLCFVAFREGNVVKPYQFVKLGAVAQFRFCPNYNPISAVLSKCTRLLSAHKGQYKCTLICTSSLSHSYVDDFSTHSELLISHLTTLTWPTHPIRPGKKQE